MKQKNMLSSIFVYLMVFSLMAGSVYAFASPAPVNLSTAGDFAILSKAGITNVPLSPTSIVGDIGVSPIGYAAITGFVLNPAVPDGSNTFATSSLVTGKVYASDYTEPTPTNLGVAVLKMQAAYSDALSRATTDPAETNPDPLGDGEIGGLTLAPGVYVFNGASKNVAITTDLTLNGGINDVWIFQIPGTLNIASGTNTKVRLTGGAQASNVFWAVADATTLGTYSTFEGNIMTAEPKTIAIQTGAVLNGRALSQGAVTLDAVNVTKPTLITDAIPPVISSTAPAASAHVNVQQANYTLSEAVASAAIVFTRTSGNDVGGVHTCTLQGTALNTGAHTNLALATDANACVAWTALVDGSTYTVTFDATDAASNAAITVTNTGVVFDTTASTVAVTAPTTPVKAATTFTFTSSEPGTQECSIDAGAWESCASGDAFSTLSDFAGLGQGAFTLNVRDTDAVGNVGTDSEAGIVKDTTLPVALINNVNGVSNGYGTNSATLTINFTADDTNINDWTLSVYDSTWGLLQNWTGTTNNLSAVEAYTATANGTYYVNLTVRDNAANINTTSFKVYVDQSAPVILSSSISSITGSGATLTVNASDAYSGINNCNYSNAGSGSLTLSGGLYTASLSSLSASTAYTVNVTCYDKAGYSVSNNSSFTTASVAAQSAVNLGTAGNFVILAKSGISTTGTTSIVGHIGVSPAAATYITGFALIMDSFNQFSASSLVTGNVYAADYTPPTPSVMTTAVSNMETAYTDAAGRASDVTELGAGNIGGMTLAPGVYKWGTGVTIPTDVTLSGNSSDVWVFQIAQTLGISSATQVILSGGAQAKNIFWQVAGQTTLGTYSTFEGNILDQTAIVLNTGATLNGRALAQTAVTLDANSVSIPVSTNMLPPTVAVMNPGLSWVNAGFNVTLNATGFNGSAVSYINYTLNSVAGQILGSVGDVFVNASGNNTLMFYGVDTSGNVETTKTIYALLDKIAPNITFFGLSATSVNIGNVITGTCTVTDNLYTNIAGVITGIDTTTAGAKTATCTATDLAGNIATAISTYTVSTASSGGGSGGGGGGGVNWQCAGWSACSSEGIRTRTCTRPNSMVTSTEKQSCTPTQTVAASQNTTTAPAAPQTTTSGSTGQSTVITGQGNSGVTPAGGNQITGQVVSPTGNTPSWWVTASVLSVIIGGLITGGYFYFRNQSNPIVKNRPAAA